MKILICFGTRPEVIKLAPVYHELLKRGVSVSICCTGQHDSMIQSLIDFFRIHVDFNLGILRKNQNLNTLISRTLIEFDNVLETIQPDIVINQGDTATAMVCALASFNRKIRIAHVEAGLRTYDLNSPYPEELYRQLIGRMAWLHFPPTDIAYKNLLNEGNDPNSILKSGNTVIDSLVYSVNKLDKGYNSVQINEFFKFLDIDKKLIIVTGHRRENIGEKLLNICKAINLISQRDDIQIIWSLHSNPKVRSIVKKNIIKSEAILITDPIDYPDFIWLLRQSFLIISDSGGIQEEASYFKVPVLVTRDNTEREESVQLNLSFIVGTNVDKIREKVDSILENGMEKIKESHPYGTGESAKLIVEYILSFDA